MTNVVKEVVPMEQRAICETAGCGKRVQLQGHSKATGKAQFRKVCSYCHQKAIAKRHGLNSMTEVVAKNAGFANASEYANHRAKVLGFKNVTHRKNSKHPYLQYRKDYCENRTGDGIWVDPKTRERKRLGDINCVCSATIIDDSQLSVDHIDGNHSNNDPNTNLQTLCHNCHSIKTKVSEDNRKKKKKPPVTYTENFSEGNTPQISVGDNIIVFPTKRKEPITYIYYRL